MPNHPESHNSKATRSGSVMIHRKRQRFLHGPLRLGVGGCPYVNTYHMAIRNDSNIAGMSENETFTELPELWVKRFCR